MGLFMGTGQKGGYGNAARTEMSVYDLCLANVVFSQWCASFSSPSARLRRVAYVDFVRAVKDKWVQRMRQPTL